jgi:hypothetical protein
MALSTYDIATEQGSNYGSVVTYEDDNGNLVNLTGYTARMQVRTYAGAAVPALSLATSSGITMGGVAGTVTISIPATTLSAVRAGSYVYDLEIQSPSAVVTKLLSGKFTIEQEVTR